MIFMELRHLRYFIAVASNMSFSEASRRLHVAQPAISQTIKDLEDELGAKLVSRNSRGIELTAAGNAFLAEAREIMVRADGAKIAVQRASKGEIGCLRIGFLPCAAGPFIPALIKLHLKEFPNVEVRLHDMNTEQQLKAFEDGKIDIGFARPFPKERSKEFVSEIVYEDHLEIVLPARHASAKKSVVDLKDLSGETFVEYYRRGSPALFGEVISTCRKAGFSPKTILEFGEMSSVILAVESGLGVSLTLGFFRGLLSRESVLRQIKPASSKIPLCAIWPAGPQEPVLASFLQTLRARKPTIKRKMERPG
ncbi:MAG TPA: LysR substrate-binding domain-containing protein [Verrucomicrobiae bacterium]|nr:LysR substrate-binding domain-containing protein [Verrucomicrobiae bacterium]